jgi:hypothetical protein
MKSVHPHHDEEHVLRTRVARDQIDGVLFLDERRDPRAALCEVCTPALDFVARGHVPPAFERRGDRPVGVISPAGGAVDQSNTGIAGPGEIAGAERGGTRVG